jgi:hypothetical protein
MTRRRRGINQSNVRDDKASRLKNRRSLLTNYRVRVFDGTSRMEISKRSARSTKEAVRECMRIARERPGDFALAQSTRQDPGGVFAEAYIVRYLTRAELVAAKVAAAVESDEDLLVSVMGLIPGPWSGPGSL